MKKTDTRRLTVHVSRKNYASLDAAPCIILEGVWLNALGYHPGDKVDIAEKGGQLVLTRIDQADIPEDPKKAAMREEIEAMKPQERRMMARMLREAENGYGR